jgi:type IV fimbrial biogenesis protein FimT
MRASGGRHTPAGGWTLVECLIAATIAVVITLFAIPAMGDFLAGYELVTHAQYLAGHLNRARSEAIMRGIRVDLCRSTDGRTCAAAGGWESGWIVHADRDRDGTIDDDDAVLETVRGAPAGVIVSPNKPLAAYVSYTSLGQARRRDGALQMGTFVLCRTGQKEVHVVLANTGRVRIERTKLPCT